MKERINESIKERKNWEKKKRKEISRDILGLKYFNSKIDNKENEWKGE